jgi:hypothetical protein
VRRPDRARDGVVKEDRQAVGGADDEQQPRLICNDGVGLLLEPARAAREHAVAVNLAEGARAVFVGPEGASTRRRFSATGAGSSPLESPRFRLS